MTISLPDKILTPSFAILTSNFSALFGDILRLFNKLDNSLILLITGMDLEPNWNQQKGGHQ